MDATTSQPTQSQPAGLVYASLRHMMTSVLTALTFNPCSIPEDHEGIKRPTLLGTVRPKDPATGSGHPSRHPCRCFPSCESHVMYGGHRWTAGLYNVCYILSVEGVMLAFKVTTVGSSVGFILPKAAQDRMKVGKGDLVYLTEAPDGGYRLTPYSPDFERQMALAETIMREDREVLRALSK